MAKSEKVRPIDLRPGDLIRTNSYPNGVTVVSSDLVTPGTKGPGTIRTSRHEWWVRTIWTDPEGRVQSHTERFTVGKFADKTVTRLYHDREPDAP